MLVMKEQMSLEDYKKESMRLMNIYEKELNEFCSEKNEHFYSGNFNFLRLLKNMNYFKICEKH